MLDGILSSTRRRISRLGERSRADSARRPVRAFEDALAGAGLAVIGEVKRKSPSRGVLAEELDPVRQAKIYEQAGAAAVSVLTEPEHFSGSNQDLRAVSEAVGIPVIRKDFILDAAQVWESRRIGADALLLIVSILGDEQLKDLLEETSRAGMAALVEVHNPTEAERAIKAGARVVGVNNRDLRDFTVDLGTARRVAPYLSRASVKVAESGIHTPAQAAMMAEAGYDAILVGEALVRARRPGELVSRMRGAV
ncbi:MAG: indole-3-glycerol phosphate synthase TrpC [bacterium]|nr:indole-3-glycerol phosphate synthase TrpC [bacterium]